MKELLKYVLIMILGLLAVVFLMSDAFAQIQILTAHHILTGEKVRFELTLSRPSQYTLVEDWENKTIMLFFPGGKFSNAAQYKFDQVHNYIVSEARLISSDFGTALQITSKNDFKTKTFTKDNGRRVYIDVFPQLTTPAPSELLQRGIAYETRGEFSKAVNQYKQALISEPGNTVVQNKLAAALQKINHQEEGKSVQVNEKADGKRDTGNGENVPETKSPVANEKIQSKQDNQYVTVVPIPIYEVSQPEEKHGNITESAAAVSAEKLGSTVVNTNESLQKNMITAANDSLKNAAAKSAGRFSGFHDLLKKSNTETYVLWCLYVIAAVLISITLLLLRKMFRLHKNTHRRKKSVKQPSGFIVPPISKNGNALNKQKLEEMRSFARKLSALYARTDPSSSSTPVNTGSRFGVGHLAKTQPMEEHTRRIEEAFSQENTSWNNNRRNILNSETINLTKKFREQNGKTDKYTAVRQLAEQNWEIWEIARELSMGTEEIKMALRSPHIEDVSSPKKDLYENIYRLADLGINTAVIALRLHIGEEEVRLALKLRESSSVES